MIKIMGLGNFLIYIFISSMEIYNVYSIGYEIRISSFELHPTESKILYIENMKIVRFPKKKELSLSGTLIVGDFPEDMKMSVTTSRKVGSTFVEQPFASFKDVDACEMFSKDTMIMPLIKKSSNIPDKCPIPKGTYQIVNLSTTPENLPRFLPHGDWNVTTEWKVNNATIYGITTYSTIVPACC
ncbi:uncharacterized protein LOC123293638 [Chrysoperla carnea]|uniref:uncharacterized protein LOC123293638 n=1 Tax=Chrysoperla carnea TaxID=189513 RepID=UPI001D087E6C|nr:uncharacterized protein LOC123293638 [Chrysoperla carnea]